MLNNAGVGINIVVVDGELMTEYLLCFSAFSGFSHLGFETRRKYPDIHEYKAKYFRLVLWNAAC